MARKRLSDLLREEGQKSGENVAKQPNQASQAELSKQAEHSKPEELDEEAATPVITEVIAAQAEQVGEFVADLRNAAAEPEPESAIADGQPEPDFEAIIAQLKADSEAAYQAAQSEKATLQEQIDSLQAQIGTQEATIQQLQAEVQRAEKQSEQLKAELESAKQMILQLSQPKATPATSKAPTSKAPTSKAASLPEPLPSPRAAEPELETAKTDFIVPTTKYTRPGLSNRPKLHEMALKKVLDHPTQPGSLPPMSAEAKPAEREGIKLTDADVGWMD